MKIIGTKIGRNVYWMTLKKKFYEKSTEEKWGPKDPNKGLSRFHKITFTAASDQVLNCQPKIVILNNICHSVTTTGVSSFCVQQILYPPFRYSGPVEKISEPVNSWCSLVPGPADFWEIF
jgi:hypothetical protein